MDHDGIVFQMSLHHLQCIWVELGYVPDTLEQERVTKLAGSCDELTQLAVLGEDLTVTLVSGQVDREGN